MILLAGVAVAASGVELEGVLLAPWVGTPLRHSYPPNAMDGPHVLEVVSLVGHVSPDGRSLDRIEVVVQPVAGQVVQHASKTSLALETERSSSVALMRTGGPGLLAPLRDRDGSTQATSPFLNDDDLATGQFGRPTERDLRPGEAVVFEVRPWWQRWESVAFVVPDALEGGAVVRLG